MVACHAGLMISANDIRVARRKHGKMTQRHLADLMGVSVRTVNGWENGATIPIAEQAQLAEVLGIVTQVAPQVAAVIDPLAELTDMELLAELARRLARLRASAADEVAPPLRKDAAATPGDRLGAAIGEQSEASSRLGNDPENWPNGVDYARKLTERHEPGAEGDADAGTVGGIGVVVSAMGRNESHGDHGASASLVGDERDSPRRRRGRAR